MRGQRINRREALATGAAAGAALALPGAARAQSPAWSRRLDFAALGDGEGWPGWRCPGVANLRRSGGQGLLEAASDVFPCDPRPVAFAVDQRFRDGTIALSLTARGAGSGLVLRRVGSREYYAAIVDDEESALVIIRRAPGGVVELARTAFRASGAVELGFTAKGARPTLLTATVAGEGQTATVAADDSEPRLQRHGDPGVLATARTVFPAEGPEAAPALGNLHLLPYGVQEGQAVMETAVGQTVLGRIKERSTAVVSAIEISSTDRRARPTRPSVVAATTGAPLAGGAALRVAADVPARVEIEFASNRKFRRSRRMRAGRTNAFHAVLPHLTDIRHGRRVYWRARLRRKGTEAVGPTRTFRVLPRSGSPLPATIAIASCASQFGPIFDELADRQPDAFVWQGDLNYPDTIGPLAQTVPAYGGIWRDFLANPRMDQVFDRTLFAVQRDDHDYGVQDANATNLVPHGLTPWEALMERRTYYRFSAGVADVWVLDQRRFKTDPEGPDSAEKTLLGSAQRDWLLRTLASSRAAFKVICSPCTLAPLSANARDGSWAAGYTAERDLLLGHLRDRVSGQAVFVTGDSHWTMVYDQDGVFEARPCPLGIPTPNDITLTQPNAAEDARRQDGVVYADDERGHFALLRADGAAGKARLQMTLVRDDGAEVFERRFEQPLRR